MNYGFATSNLFFAEKNLNILKNIYFSFLPGQIVCILGNNGSGKSTLLKICAGVLKPTCGEVILNNKNIFCLNDADRAQRIGWLPQNISRPHNMNLHEFMELTPSDNEQMSLELFDVAQFKDKNIATLSGGEWKRSQLARLWQSNYTLILLDEPDSDLDLKHKKLLAQFCKNYALKNNTIMLIATHDIVFARAVADRLCALVDGYLVWNSNHNEFWNTKVINKIYSVKVF